MDNEQGNTINLKELFSVILKNYLVIIITTIVITAIVGLYTHYAINPKYESKSLIIVNKVVVDNQPNNSSDIFRYGSELAKRYSIIAKSNAVIDNVHNYLLDTKNLDISKEKIKSSFEVVSVNETEILQITVTYPNSEIAKVLVNTISNESMKVYEEKYLDASVEFIDHGEENSIPVSPNLKLNVVIGFVLGLMLSVGFVLIYEFLNKKIKTEKDVEYYLNVPFLGSVPDIKKIR